MDKRDFLKTSATALAGTMLMKLTPLAEAEAAPTPPAATRTNWAGNYTYSTDHLDLASTVDEVRHSIAANPHLRALGARHSFNGIADSTEAQLSLPHMDSIVLDTAAKSVTVGAGVKYGQLAPYIDQRGFAVHNLASLPHIGVVGACATATHGSGVNNGNLSTSVRAMELVTADGSLVTLSREKLGDTFEGLVVHLGSLGVITRITLFVEPRFDVAQTVFENLSFSQLEHNFDAIFGAAYSVSLFTDWQQHRATQVWIKRRLDQPESAQAAQMASMPQPAQPASQLAHPTAPHAVADFYGATPATRKMHPIGDHPAEPCTEQMGIPGPWYERLPHFRMNFTPSSGAELQTEYFVPLEKGYEAILAVEELRDQITPHLLVTELRTIAADNLWLSPAYQRQSMAIHFTWKPEWPAVKQILPQIEAKLAPFAPRPHWAKLFTMPPATIEAQYPKLADYKSQVTQYDPKGKFRNAFINTNIYGA